MKNYCAMLTNLITQKNDARAKNRAQAGVALAQKVAELNAANAVVVGIPRGGVCVAAQVAEELQLPLEVMICRKIKHPSAQDKTIGSVSTNEVVMHDWPYSAPQDQLYFQTISLRNKIKYENDLYYGEDPLYEFEGKAVILVDDVLTNTDAIIACIQEIRKHRARRIILAVPFVQAEAARIIQSEVDDLVYLRLQEKVKSPLEYYDEFPEVKEWTVRDLLKRSKAVVMAPIALYGRGNP